HRCPRPSMRATRRVTTRSSGGNSGRAAQPATTPCRASTTRFVTTHARRFTMPFIDTIGASYVTGEAFAMYERQQAHYGFVPSYATVFSHRPEVMRRWAELLSAIKRPMDKRRFELATFAAAHELRSTLCTLAHGKALLAFFSREDVIAMAR